MHDAVVEKAACDNCMGRESALPYEFPASTSIPIIIVIIIIRIFARVRHRGLSDLLEDYRIHHRPYTIPTKTMNAAMLAT